MNGFPLSQLTERVSAAQLREQGRLMINRHPATAHPIAMPISEPVITSPRNERRSLLGSNFAVVSADGISAQDLPDS
jgi:hypothetical protein